MKKIIDGVKYDTETAKLVAEWGNDLSSGDFKFYQENLYQKKNGEYFLQISGGAMSECGEVIGSMKVGSRTITALQIQEAKEWAEKRLDGDEYIAIFGDVEE